MNELTRRLLSEIDVHRAALREAVQAVPEVLRGRRPSPDRWSVAEVLEHLAVTEAVIARLVADGAASLEPGPPPTVAELPAPTLARLLDRTGRVEAPERVRPQGTLDAATAWQRLEASRIALRGAVEGAEDRDLTAVQRPHPLLGNLDLYQWVISVGGHEVRHTVQIRETAAELMKE
jgi:hypothetical protein